jgi:hypothetical protein
LLAREHETAQPRADVVYDFAPALADERIDAWGATGGGGVEVG